MQIKGATTSLLHTVGCAAPGAAAPGAAAGDELPGADGRTKGSPELFIECPNNLARVASRLLQALFVAGVAGQAVEIDGFVYTSRALTGAELADANRGPLYHAARFWGRGVPACELQLAARPEFAPSAAAPPGAAPKKRCGVGRLARKLGKLVGRKGPVHGPGAQVGFPAAVATSAA